MDASRIVKCAEDDPLRCQEVTALGQCQNKSNEGSDKCEIHHRHNKAQDRDKVRMYRLAVWQTRLDEFADSKDIKSLASEIGILRMTLEAIISQIGPGEQAKFYLMSNTIGDLVSRIERTVVSCHNLEKKTGKLLDQSTLLRLAGDIVDIITALVPDTALSELIGNEIIEKVLKTQCLDTEN